ncbi:MAG: helix-turn-helix transcriptional regulator [Betaproteobacteria bacterium]|nr:helix-turn-helix transcriptional regulator [Betaproteobacteria bacterium]
MWLPRPPLASCLRAVMCRDTRGVNLDETQRFNHFPVSPTCSITWYFTGTAELVSPAFPASGEHPHTPIERITFGGPITRPIVVRNPGPIHAMVVLLLPDAIAQLTGIDPNGYLDRVVPVQEAFDLPWQDFCRAVDEAPDDAQRVALIEDFLLPRWRHARPEANRASHLIADWSQALALRAATSGLGRSLRQTERRIKQWTGQALRELQGIGRSERAFFDAVVGVKAGEVNWSEVAANTGYADQSHLCRQTRRITGFAPDELRRRIATEESFWAYRLWGYSEGTIED